MKISIEVPYRDLDAMGHVNNAVYLAYFELARQKYWDRLVGLKTFRDIGFVVARAEVDYRASAHLGDRLEVEIRCSRTGRSSFDFDYTITRAGELVARGKTTQVLWDWESNRKREFTADLRTRIARLEAEPRAGGEV
jgi:acyl-CoA thioester hydrolase